MFEKIDNRTEEIATIIVDCACKVFLTLGPGLLESIYETCICHELSNRNVKFQKQVSIPVVYDGIKMNDGFRIDILVEDLIIVEIKAVDELKPVFYAQTLTYLRLTKKRLGLLINFNVPNFKQAVRRVIL